MPATIRHAEVIDASALTRVVVSVDGAGIVAELANGTRALAGDIVPVIHEGSRWVAVGRAGMRLNLVDHYLLAGIRWDSGSASLRGTYFDARGVRWDRLRHVAVAGAEAAVWLGRAYAELNDPLEMPTDFYTGEPDVVSWTSWVPGWRWDALVDTTTAELGLQFGEGTHEAETTSESSVVFTPYFGLYAGLVLCAHASDVAWSFGPLTSDSETVPVASVTDGRFYACLAQSFGGEGFVPAGVKSLYTCEVSPG